MEPEFVSQYVPQPDTVGTVLGGIGGALSSLSGIDFTNPNKFTPAPINLRFWYSCWFTKSIYW